LKKYPALFLIGGSVYASLELLTRQRTHPSMFLAGGICLCLIDKICLGSMRHQPVAIKCAAGAGIITAVELAVGLVVNRGMNLNVWDYSDMPGNFMGQICLPYSLLWCALTLPALGICHGVNRDLKPVKRFRFFHQ
jgi:hypothetical protein